MHQKLQKNIDFELSRIGRISKWDLLQTRMLGDWHLHLQFSGGKLTVRKERKSFQSRNKATLQFFDEVARRFPLPDCEFFVNTDDYCNTPRYPIFSVCRRKKAIEKVMTYPDFTFTSWPENLHWRPWPACIEYIDSRDDNCWESKKDGLFFRGNYSTARIREDFAALYDYDVGTSEYRKQMDVRSSDCTNSADHKAVGILDHYHWKFLLHIEGRSYASRIKWLMLMKSMTVYYHRPDPFVEFWYELLEDGVNCISVSTDKLKQLPAILEHYKQNPAEAVRVAENGYETVKLLDHATLYGYTATLVQGYAARLEGRAKPDPSLRPAA